MILYIFLIFVAIAVVLIFLGFYNQEHTELPLIGFLFLFLLSLNLLSGSIEYRVGEYENVTYTYDNTSFANLTLNTTHSETRYVYDDYVGEGLTNQLAGYWLAVCSIIGFIGTLISLKNQFRRGQDGEI